ncbi:helix-turn-helix domain-containing protein [Enterobacter sp. RHBSTW-00975]|uniref:helix-turn-helix domain-containing protein n=1 Tax=Enterobacter sp. RHBSTW-00975 TaxID=2742673 RepID=UPI0015E4ABD6|nr:helix-turn-helix domain-containing protein [Enterobacter sp. RHBSTW-00975]QLO91463.1 helix-turn-helix domain-containing protein [Enterobacter sp. RHBSTW-00975]
MSLMAKAMGVKVGNSLRKLVLIKLADNANDKGECWPSYQHIADQCECSRTAVRNHIDALEEMGLIRRENRVGVNNGNPTTDPAKDKCSHRRTGCRFRYPRPEPMPISSFPGSQKVS